jgi:prolyl-tRNA synthetase
MAAIVEQNHDEYGIIWPSNIAPFEVALVIINLKVEEQVEAANKVYEELSQLGFDVLLDDRDERAGVKFNDMDLIGVPLQVTFGRGLAEGEVEVKVRKENNKTNVKLENLVQFIKESL